MIPWLDRFIGMGAYATPYPPVRAKLRSHLEDFVVREVLRNGRVAQPAEGFLRRERFALFVLEKIGKSTLEALEEISSATGIPEEEFGIAGLKDKRAHTFQFITIPQRFLDRLKGAEFRDIRLYPVNGVSHPLSPEHMAGNRFELVLRDVDSPSLLRFVLDRVRAFPNFFGYQRFGVLRPVSHLVGKRIVLKDFEGAIRELLCRTFPGEPPHHREARERLSEDGDYREALRYFPRSLSAERKVLRHLAKNPRDFVGALRRLGRSLLNLYVEAYQSYIFNLALTKRMERGYPLSLPIPGDLRFRYASHTFPALKVVGYSTELGKAIQDLLLKEVLESEGVSPADFRVPQLPEIRASGWVRSAVALVENLEVREVEGDEATLRLSFFLMKGAYASSYLREVLKPDDPASYGF